MTTTKDVIFRTFLDLLREKPFDKITIRNIVETANINRNTFYYYYSDIYELLEEIFTMEMKELTGNHNTGFRWLIGFLKMLETSYENKSIINNICSSRSYEYFETYMFKSCRIILSDYVHDECRSSELNEDVLEFIISFYMNGITGALSEWFRTGMQDAPDQIMKKFVVIFEGIVSTLRRAEMRFKDESENTDEDADEDTDTNEDADADEA